MDSKTFIVFLIVAGFFNPGIAFPSNDPKNLKLSETPNKYASPQIYVFGGGNGEHEFLTSASQFNSSTGEWEATTDMAFAKRSTCGAVVGTKIYIFGGYAGGRLRTTEVYDCQTGTYSQYRSMLNGVSDCGAAVLNGFIYVAGGNDGTKSVSSVIRYNIQTTRRENVTPMHTARYAHQLVELGGRLYAIGGDGIKTVEAYNSTTDRWTISASTHYEHRWFGAAVHEGKIYVCSEYGFEVYSPDVDEWTVLAPPNNYQGGTLVSMSGKLWAVGGGPSKSVFTYNSSTKQWYQRADMDVARDYHSTFVVNH